MEKRESGGMESKDMEIVESDDNDVDKVKSPLHYLDAAYIKCKETIKAQKQLIALDIEMVKEDEEMYEEGKKMILNLYLKYYDYLMKGIQDITESMKKEKKLKKKRDSRERESKDLFEAGLLTNNIDKVKSILKRGIADIKIQI